MEGIKGEGFMLTTVPCNLQAGPSPIKKSGIDFKSTLESSIPTLKILIGSGPSLVFVVQTCH